MKLQLSFPLETIIISQYFGNPGPLYLSEGMKGHNGIDFMSQHGVPVYASHDGLASFQIDAGGGHGVVIVTDKEYDWEYGTAQFKTIYWHLCDGLKEPQFASPFQGKTGFTPIKRGQLVGYADSTGQSTGDHLHWGLKPVAKGEDWGSFYNLDQNNGYAGSIDPLPYLSPLEASKTDDLVALTDIKKTLLQTALDIAQKLLQKLRGQ